MSSKGPPPPPGSKRAVTARSFSTAAAVPSLATLSQQEKQAWVKSKAGLDLNSLTLQFYPARDFLIDAGFPEEKAGNKFSEDENSNKENLQQRMREKTEELLEELFQLEETIALPHIKALESKVKNWKPNRDGDGLSSCYKQLNQAAQQWRKVVAKQQKAEIQPSSPRYSLFKINKEKAERLHAEYEKFLEIYTNLAEGDEKAATFTKLQGVIAQLKKQQKTIKSVAPQLEANKKTLAQAQGKLQARLKNVHDEIESLTEETKKLRQARDPRGEKKIRIGQNEAKIAALKQELMPTASVYQTEQIEIDKARLALRETQIEHDELQLIQALFDLPESWQEISSKPRKTVVITGKKAKQRDTTGMVKDTQAQQSIAFDIQFLPMNAIANLARFFASDPSEELSFLHDRFGLYALMTKINSKASLNEIMNFTYLMDIAEGKTVRPLNVYSADADFFKSIEIDNSVSPDYIELLARSNRHHNVREEKEDSAEALPEVNFNEKMFEQYCKERGISVTPYTPPRSISKERKEYHYDRKIDLSYLNSTQMLNLANFFSRNRGEFLKDGVVDIRAINSHVNDVFNHTGLSFEEIMSIASGHLVRQYEKFADEDPRYALVYDTEKRGNPPRYEDFIKQRKDYLAAQKRLAAQAVAAPEMMDVPEERLEETQELPEPSPSVSARKSSSAASSNASFPRLSTHRELVAKARGKRGNGELTNLGLRKSIVELLKDEKGLRDPISFLIAPHYMNMNHLLIHAPQKRGWLPVIEYSSAAMQQDLKELKEFCVLLNQSEGHHAEHHVAIFLKSVNERAAEDPCYKLILLKGYLLRLQERYGGPINGPYYKMGALCTQLMATIDKASAIGVPNIKDILKDLLDDDICRAEYDHFKSQLTLSRKRDEQASSRPKRS